MSSCHLVGEKKVQDCLFKWSRYATAHITHIYFLFENRLVLSLRVTITVSK